MQFGISNIKQRIVKRKRSLQQHCCVVILRARVSRVVTRSPDHQLKQAFARALTLLWWSISTIATLLMWHYSPFSISSPILLACVLFIYLSIFIYFYSIFRSLSLFAIIALHISSFLLLLRQVFMCRKKSTLFLFQLKWYLMCTNK